MKLCSLLCVCVYVCVVRSVCTHVSFACTINPSIYNAFIIRQRLSHNLLLHHLVMQLSMFSVYVCVGCWVHVGCWVCVCVWAAGCILQGELYFIWFNSTAFFSPGVKVIVEGGWNLSHQLHLSNGVT